MAEGFLSRVIVTESCWLWHGYHDKDGYARYNAGWNGDVLAHRISYRLFVGPIPDGTEIDHTCRVRGCVNPAHLEAVTHTVNVRRGISGVVNGGRQRSKPKCPAGHPYSGRNLYISPRGDRGCRICRYAAVKRYKERCASEASDA